MNQFLGGELLTRRVSSTRFGRQSGAGFPTWSLELKFKTWLTLGRWLGVLSPQHKSAEGSRDARAGSATDRLCPGWC